MVGHPGIPRGLWLIVERCPVLEASRLEVGRKQKALGGGAACYSTPQWNFPNSLVFLKALPSCLLLPPPESKARFRGCRNQVSRGSHVRWGAGHRGGQGHAALSHSNDPLWGASPHHTWARALSRLPELPGALQRTPNSLTSLPRHLLALCLELWESLPPLIPPPLRGRLKMVSQVSGHQNIPDT